MSHAASVLVLCFGLLYVQGTQECHVPKNSTVMAQHYGNGIPPLSSMTDMDNKPYEVEPVRGHWTLLYYWADWCVPCINEGIPHLISFANSHQHLRDRFRIVAIRFNSMDEAGDWKDFHVKSLKLEDTLWHGVPPFPLVYDTSTRMSTDWGIHELPTYALIDPKGNLVKGGDLEMLQKELMSK